MSLFRSTVAARSSLPRLGAVAFSPRAMLPISAVGRRHSGHVENESTNWGPWMACFTRTPTRAKFYMWTILLSAFAAPFGVIQYQLKKQNKHLLWYPAEWDDDSQI